MDRRAKQIVAMILEDMRADPYSFTFTTDENGEYFFCGSNPVDEIAESWEKVVHAILNPPPSPDDFEVKIDVGTDGKGAVIAHFDRTVNFLGLSPQGARALAEGLRKVSYKAQEELK